MWGLPRVLVCMEEKSIIPAVVSDSLKNSERIGSASGHENMGIQKQIRATSDRLATEGWIEEPLTDGEVLTLAKVEHQRILEVKADHIYDYIEQDQRVCDGEQDGNIGTYVVVAEHGEEYILDPITPTVRRFRTMADARAIVAGLIIEHRRSGQTVSIISESKWGEGCFMLHGKDRTLTIQLNCRLSEAAYHYWRIAEIEREREAN